MSFTQILRVMKLTAILLTVCCVHLMAAAGAQTISYSGKNVTLKEIFTAVKKQTGYLVVYNANQISSAQLVTVDANNQPLTEFLRTVLNGKGLDFTIENKTIVVTPQKKDGIQTTGPLKTQLHNTDNVQIDVHGVVKDEVGKPAADVSVRVKGTSKGTTTNDNGEFTLTGVDPAATLVFSSVNMETYETKLNGRNEITLVLKAKVSKLEDVEITAVNTGYQTIPKERATGSFSQPNKQMFESRVSTDVLSKLEGITSGLVFNSAGITGKNSAQISVRGRSTIFANDQPLIVVNNFPYDGDITNINPNDVESVTVLKDAAAASIWGVRAGNGVIVITTKKGQFNEPLKVQFNTNVTVLQKPNLFYDPNFLNSSDFIDVEKFLYSKGFYSAALGTGYQPVSPIVEILEKQRTGAISSTDADNQINALRGNDIRKDLDKYFYRNAVNQQYALNISSGGPRYNSILSVGYDRNLSSLVNNDYSRITLNTISTYKLLDKLILTGGINYIENQTRSDNTLNQLTNGFNGTVTPYTQLADANGNPIPVVSGFSNSFKQAAIAKGFLDWTFVPLNELRAGINSNNTNRANDIRFSANIKYQIINGLSVQVYSEYEKNKTTNNGILARESYYVRSQINQFSIVNSSGNVTGYNIPVGSILNNFNSTLASKSLRGQVDYSKITGDHFIAALIGAEAREVKSDFNTASVYGYNESTASFQNVNTVSSFPTNPTGGSSVIPSGVNQGWTLNRFRSYYANASYTYKSRYMLSSSARVDGSNFFGINTNQRNIPLWSVGGRWDVAKEAFYKVSWLPSLQLRLTYGYNGNLDNSITAFPTFIYSGNPSALSNFRQASLLNIGNPDIRWETDGVLNAGIDFRSRNDIVAGTIEYYYKKGTGLVGDESVAPNTGLSLYRGNFADMKGKGVDISLTTKNIDGKLKWYSTLLFSWATDRVTSYKGTIVPARLLGSEKVVYPWEGQPVFGIYSLKWAGLDPANGDPQGYDINGNVSKDYVALTNVGSFSQLVFNGSARPVYFGGFNNRIVFKNLSISANISYKLKYFFRRNSINYNRLINGYTGHQDFASRWQKAGDEKSTNVPSLIYPANSTRDYFYTASEVLVDKGDHIRLQDISVSYEFVPPSLAKRVFTSAQIYAYANNLGLIWKANKDGLDPDYPAGGIPNQKSFSLGLKVKF